jgi:hypothetical protein
MLELSISTHYIQSSQINVSGIMHKWRMLAYSGSNTSYELAVSHSGCNTYNSQIFGKPKPSFEASATDALTV